jgi:hypothetical protein
MRGMTWVDAKWCVATMERVTVRGARAPTSTAILLAHVLQATQSTNLCSPVKNNNKQQQSNDMHAVNDKQSYASR